MWKSAAASVCARLSLCRFRAGAASTEFSKFFPPAPQPSAKQHIALLQQLAALAERARASQPHDASSAAPKLSSAMEKPQRSGLLPASDRVGDVALAFVGQRLRPFVLGAIGLAAISLFALVIWLGWRGPDETDGKAHAATAASVSAGAATVNSATAHPRDNGPVSKANPGGESLIPLERKAFRRSSGEVCFQGGRACEKEDSGGPLFLACRRCCRRYRSP